MIASYSSKGPTAIDHIMKPDLVAPGNQVVSAIGSGLHTLTRMYPQSVVGRSYFRLSGTSMAAPVVSGAAALLLDQDASLTPSQVKARLMRTARKAFPARSIVIDPETGMTHRSVYDVFTVGAGYLDISEVLANRNVVAGSAPSPQATYNPQTRSVSLNFGGATAWGSSVVWGDSAVWGCSAVWGSSVVSGDTAVRGDSAVRGNSFLSCFSVV